MKKILAAVLAVVMLYSLAACSRFGPHDNPPMAVATVDGRL